MSWVYLVLAGLCEIAWPVGLKLALGTAYAVWTGIGAAGTFLVGIWFFGDATSLGRYVGVTLIISGVVVLKLSH